MRTPSVEVSAKIMLRQRLAVSGFAITRSSVPGRPFFIMMGCERDVERAGLQQAFGGIGQHLRIEVVDIGFDHGDGERFVGAGRSRRE